MSNEPAGPWYHEDLSRFRDALMLTEAESDFSSRLIEKDYYCSLLLQDLSGTVRAGSGVQGGHLPEQSSRGVLPPERGPGFLYLDPAGCERDPSVAGRIADQGHFSEVPGRLA